MLALKEPNYADVLIGPIISMDEEGPICGRTVLVPLEAHVRTAAQDEMSKTELIDYLVSPKSAQDAAKYIQEIKVNLRTAFPGHHDNHIFKLISNLSLTVVQTQPSENNKLIKQELRFRKIFHDNNKDLQGVGSAMERALSRMSDDEIINF